MERAVLIAVAWADIVASTAAQALARLSPVLAATLLIGIICIRRR